MENGDAKLNWRVISRVASCGVIALLRSVNVGGPGGTQTSKLEVDSNEGSIGKKSLEEAQGSREVVSGDIHDELR